MELKEQHSRLLIEVARTTIKEVKSMLRKEDISIGLIYQQYLCKSYMRNLEGTESVLMFESTQDTEDRP